MHDSVPPRPTADFDADDAEPRPDVGHDVDSSMVFEWLERDVRPEVDDAIADVIGDSEFSDRLAYQVQTGGKRIRPGIALTVAELCGLDRDQSLDIAASIELIHTYSLVHDDLTDGDRVRRDEPAFWVAFDEEDAINVGDMLLTHALEAMPESLTDRAIATVREMTEGQQMDLDFVERRDCTVTEYLTMVWKKTGVLFDLCVTGPQVVSGTTLDIDHEALGRLWQAFQIRDDMLDLEPDNGRDTVGNDIREGRRTLMVGHAADEEIYDVLDKPPAETSDADVAFVRDRFEAHGSLRFARQRMQSNVEDAVRTLASLPESPQRDRLMALCKFVTARGTSSQGR